MAVTGEEAGAVVVRQPAVRPVLQLVLPHMQEYISEMRRQAVTRAVPGSRSATSSSSSSSSEQEQERQAAILRDIEVSWTSMLLEIAAEGTARCHY
jgi:hypothetical protein